MTDTATESTAVATRPERAAREIRVVESVSPIMDTARFEHLGRVATVMARAGLMPMSLTHYKDGEGPKAPMIPLDFETVQARAFLIANQADLWKADPNAVAQCCSLVHGKLMFEGKLVHGLIETRLGIKLRYQFGTYVAATRSIDLEKMPGADDQGLGVLVTGRFPDEDFDREIVGSVGMWHKGSSSPWGAPTAWPRQLRYMGAREWARAHSPGLLLGIMTDDEIDAARDDRRPTETLQPVEQPKISVGFTKPAEPVAEVVETVDPEVETGQDEIKHDADGVVNDESADLADGGEGAVIEGEREEVTPEVETEQEQPAQDAPADPASTPSESLPSEPSSAEAAAPSETVAGEPLDPEEDPEFVNPGYPEPGGVYHLTGDAWGSAGRRETYKDGEPFSSATRRAALAIYEDHKPEGPGGQTEEATTAPVASDAPSELNDAFDLYTMAVTKAADFGVAKTALNVLAKTPEWKAAMAGTDVHRVRQARMSLALRGEALKAEGKPWPDVLDDLLLFRCWCEITDDADAIQGNFAALVPTPLYQSLDADRRASFDASIKARMVQIRDGGA